MKIFTLISILLIGVSARGQNPLSMGFGPQSSLSRERREESEFSRLLSLPPKDPLRVVNGRQVRANSPGWVRFTGRVEGIESQRIVVRGNFSNYFGPFVLINFPDPCWHGRSLDLSNALWALPVGKFPQLDGPDLPILDYGKIWTPPPVLPLTEDQKKAIAVRSALLSEKALKSNQEDADRGDAYGELRMGERYRDGDGVAKDPRLAREWLAKSAAQGNLAAKRELSELP